LVGGKKESRVRKKKVHTTPPFCARRSLRCSLWEQQKKKKLKKPIPIWAYPATPKQKIHTTPESAPPIALCILSA
jgi:hypothetical protein